MNIYVRVSPFAPVPEVGAFAVRCEEAGFDGVGFVDSQMMAREVFVTMAHAASLTRRVRLITAVTNPMTRHASVIASAAASIDDIAQGRVELWVGRGFTSVELAGLPAANSRQLRDCVLALRRLFAGDWDVFPGAHSRLQNSGHSIPVSIAAEGPRTTRLAGEVADGILVAGGSDPAGWTRARELVHEGARSVGRDPEGLRFCLNLLTCIRADREAAIRHAGPLIALRLDDAAWLREHGIDARGAVLPQAFRELYPDPMHAEDHERALDLAASLPYDLRLEIADKLGAIGSPADCVERIRKAAAAGFDAVFIRTMDTHAFPEAEVDLFAREVRPALAAVSG